MVSISSVLASSLTLLHFKVNTNLTVDHVPEPSLSTNLTDANQTAIKETNSYINASSSAYITDPILSNTSAITYKQPNIAHFFNSIFTATRQNPETVTNFYNNNPLTSSTADPILLENSNFTIYSYGGYSVQQPNLTQLFFTFPNNTNQGQLAGSDALSLNTYTIQKIDFDATFTTPKIGAFGFDEMTIFATSDTDTYKGTEFGIRMDLKDGCIYGYIQEPEDSLGDVNFQMLNLMPNDGMIHHYTLIILGSGVLFNIDGVEYAYLSFPSNTDYSNFGFSILAVVHRFTDDWNSVGDNMTVENFALNQ